MTAQRHLPFSLVSWFSSDSFCSKIERRWRSLKGFLVSATDLNVAQTKNPCKVGCQHVARFCSQWLPLGTLISSWVDLTLKTTILSSVDLTLSTLILSSVDLTINMVILTLKFWRMRFKFWTNLNVTNSDDYDSKVKITTIEKVHRQLFLDNPGHLYTKTCNWNFKIFSLGF